MMLLSRFWYAILGVALAAVVALLYVSIHQHNRLRESDTRLIIDHDRDIVDWYLRIDARRRLDALAIASVDDQIRRGITTANAQEKIGSDVREPMRKRLADLAGKIGTMLRDEPRGGASPIALLAVDGRGRVVAHVNFDRASQVKDETFELGGFPVVADALHGWLRDDTWALDRDSLYRVVARPVVAAEGAPPAGAVVSIRRVDDGFARNLVDRTEAPVLFYVNAPDGDGLKVVARATPEKGEVSFDGVTVEGKLLDDDKGYAESGASSLKNVGPLTMGFSRMVGAAWEAGGGYAVARKVVPIADPSALLAGADESDKKAVPIAIVILIAILAIGIGVGATFVEHTVPTNKLVGEAERLRKGEQDALPLAKLTGPYRKIGQDVNEGLERVLAKGGGASRKAADLEQILGPVPAAPQMSAFSFNLDGAAPPKSTGNDLFPQLPPSAPISASPVTDGGLGAGSSGGLSIGGGAPAAGLGAPARPAPPVKPAAPPPRAPATSAPAIKPTPPTPPPESEGDDDDATMVAKIPDELMAASKTGELRQIENADEIIQWRATFDEFVEMRKRCGEPTNGLSFEKFQVQLRRNKETLVKQYGCKRVKFTVYEKDGKAALKATPIKDS
jgi:hypothetical protein